VKKLGADEQIQFLLKVQRLLGEGVFVATYKYALLLSLADLSVEKGDDSGDSLEISTQAIAEKFIEYYWRHAAPFPGVHAEERLLRQNTGRQAAVIHHIAEFRGSHDHTLVQVKSDPERWKALVGFVRYKVVDMPLYKLQTIGQDKLVFLYEHSEGSMSVELLPGVAYCFRRFHRLITDMVRGAWLRYVRRHNQDMLGAKADLSAFLFGSEREVLSPFKPILSAIQEGSCFYCLRTVRPSSVEIDHFVPWSRYPVDLGHNFVMAHKVCNSSKSDLLASESHLNRWLERNVRFGEVLSATFSERQIAHDLSTSIRIVRWAYGQTASVGGLTWEDKKNLVPLSSRWIRSLSLVEDSTKSSMM